MIQSGFFHSSCHHFKGLFAFIFKLVGIAVILGACFGMVGIGWIYAFGDCSGWFFIFKLGFENLNVKYNLIDYTQCTLKQRSLEYTLSCGFHFGVHLSCAFLGSYPQLICTLSVDKWVFKVADVSVMLLRYSMKVAVNWIYLLRV